ncbi:MAG: BrnA antitoxin family protein [Patescibacteria group bacterium]
MKKRIHPPKYNNEDRERAYWSKIDLSQYADPEDFEFVSFPNLKPTSRSISIRIPEFLLMRIKEQSNELNVPYQSLIKHYIARGTVEHAKENAIKKHQP